MHMLPAVDIKNGKAVRLFQGKADQEKIYNPSPLAAAEEWLNQGATYLHVVDLDGAFAGESENEKHILEIARHASVPVETGGGIRSIEKVERLLAGGIERVIIGTKALEDRDFLDQLLNKFPQQINVGIDAREGKVAVRGWVKTSEVKAEDFIRQLSGSGVAAIIYTDISRDGALKGPNIASLKRATEITDIPIIASGGVSTLNDLKKLSLLPLFGIISGKALYENCFTLPEAMATIKPALC